LTLIAPIDEAFTTMSPLIATELHSDKRGERLNTLLRSHIIPSSLTRIFDLPDGESLLKIREERLRALMDMNGDVVTLDSEIGRRAGILHSINGIRPLEHSHYGTARVSNGTLYLVPEIFIGKAFLEQKYHDVQQRYSVDGIHPKLTLWELFTNYGFTKFCEAAERVGLDKVFKEPLDKENRITVFAPVDEAFLDINVPATFFEKLPKVQIFVNSHIFDAHGSNRIGQKLVDVLPPERSVSEGLYFPSGLHKASNGDFIFMAKCLLVSRRTPGWDLNPTPRSVAPGKI